jgi:hypothetical protein
LPHSYRLGERGPDAETAQKRRARSGADGAAGADREPGRARHRETEGHRGAGRGGSP